MSCQCCDKDKAIEELQEEVDDLSGELQVAKRDLDSAEDELEAYKYVVLKLDALVRNRIRANIRSDYDDTFLATLQYEIESV